MDDHLRRIVGEVPDVNFSMDDSGPAGTWRVLSKGGRTSHYEPHDDQIALWLLSHGLKKRCMRLEMLLQRALDQNKGLEETIKTLEGKLFRAKS